MLTTTNYGLKKPEGTDIVDIQNFNYNADVIDIKLKEVNTALSELAKDISNSVVTTPTIAYGMNNVIKNTGKVAVNPRFTMVGKTAINLLGRDGNCEDVSKFILIYASTPQTFVLDSTAKMFGTNSIKYKLLSGTGNTSSAQMKDYGTILDSSKYYCFSGYMKSSDGLAGGYVACRNTDGSKSYGSAIVSSTAWTRKYVKFQGDASITKFGLSITTGDATVNAGYVNFDGIMLEEITQAQYNDTNFTPSPYVDSYSCLTNPLIEIRHDNIVINGNTEKGIGYWIPDISTTSLSVDSGKFKLVTATNNCFVSQLVDVKPNTDYYLSGNISGNANIWVTDLTKNIIVKTGVGTFNTGANSKMCILIRNATLGTGIADSIMLVEGTVALTEYKTCRLERTVIEGNFADGDSFTYENGEVTGLKNTRHTPPLFGKDYDWQYYDDYAGFKRIYLAANSLKPIPNVDRTGCLTKYNGDIVSNIYANSFTAKDQFSISSSGGNVYISVADIDTGFIESIAPNADEAKAFMNGWKSSYVYNSRCIIYVSVVDGLYPSCIVSANITSTFTTATSTITVDDASKFKVSDLVYLKSGGLYSIQSMSGNNITVNGSITSSWSSSPVLIKTDNSDSGSYYLLPFCKNNVAPGYEGYRLHYKLANPEPLTDINTRIVGDIPTFDVGDNYVFLDSGVVLGEVANPQTDTAAYYVNNTTIMSSLLKSKVETLNAIYKNAIYDSIWGKYTTSAYGNERYGATNANFDPTAVYTVDYKILATQAPQIGTIGCSYSQDIVSAINGLQEAVDSRQKADSSLDTLIGLSKYEEINITDYTPLNWFGETSYVYAMLKVSMVPKDYIPHITLNNLQFECNIGGVYVNVTNKMNLVKVIVSTKDIHIRWSTTDATVMAAIKANGISIHILQITAKCEGGN
ncbi:hypothetical protein psyc5s11_55000 [Clostridium gelidum]|uniref:Tail fiber protein n=1 Tax=Clostridium gelidum TaxID=704125 RepID=A0ABM7TBY1_9CLOT|nr:phage tail protein [Clostridium gelidum]BCZ49433.1 hypothetical protein psyc5s11_55000 [Clostridium gelidum]